VVLVDAAGVVPRRQPPDGALVRAPAQRICSVNPSRSRYRSGSVVVIRVTELDTPRTLTPDRWALAWISSVAQRRQ
jgi:hypothetical protein